MILSTGGEGTLQILLANFRRIFTKGINSIYLKKIKVSVELNITELLICCTFNFISQIMKCGSVLSWKG